MTTSNETYSIGNSQVPENGMRSVGGLSEKWPMVSRAMSRYSERVADEFSRTAYESVEAGLIRHDERKRLAAKADELGIKAFDAQLLIACTIRQWALDHEYDATPSPDAPKLSFEYKAWGQVWMKLALMGLLAVALDGVIIWKWLS